MKERERTMARLDIDAIDRRYKWMLLVVSAATLVALAAAALRENVHAVWRVTRSRYANLLREKATDARGRELADQFEVRVVQNVLPELGTIDRCITCHPGIDDPRMTDVPQPYRKHPGDYLVHHPPEKFGCTICHRGQGRALDFDEAKGIGHHWEYPLLPASMTASACGVCHAADEVESRGGETYAFGKTLFESKGCSACHKLDGRGGSLGPELDNEGLKVPGQLVATNLQGPRTLPQWLIEHFEDPQRIVADSQMRPPQLNEDEKLALTAYMLSLQERDLKQHYLSPVKHLEIYKQAHPDPMTGEQLFARFCANCHATGEYGGYDKFFARFMPAIRGASFVQTASPEYVETSIRQGRPGTIMPAWNRLAGGLRDDEIRRLREYLLSRPLAPEDRLSSKAIATAQDASRRIGGDVAQGQVLFERNCTGCHGFGGVGWLGPALNNPVFQQAATDGFIFGTIAYGRRNTAMPSFYGPESGGFGPREIEHLVAYVRSLGGKTKQVRLLTSAATERLEKE